MKKIITVLLALSILLISVACAETGVAYNVYHMDGDAVDSLIRATVEVEDGKITSVIFDEKLLPVSFGGAEGWAELPEGVEAKGEIDANDKRYAPAFVLDGTNWAIGEDLTVSNEDKGELIAYIITDEGGDWYFAQDSAELIDVDGNEIMSGPIGTKASIEHGVHFWASDITFPGNIEAIENFIVENGVEYALDDIAKNDDGYWTIADAVSGATLAGTPNYLLLAQEAYEKAVK